MEIVNSTFSDVEEIFRLYENASALQRLKQSVTWPTFERSLVEAEIKEKRQWKLIIENRIACVWATTFSDPLIWGERNSDPAVYIHRIATHPAFRGNGIVSNVIEWAKKYASINDMKYVRLDTVGENAKLTSLYTACGFTFLGLEKLADTSGLPPHYKKGLVSLFELAVSK
jgi:ribosomal protein S18 acetylase RimI-like enzyme